jgi:hypothetical protein
VRAVEVRLDDHRIVRVVHRDQLVALIRERSPGVLEVARDLTRAVVDVARADQLVARMVERRKRRVELVPILGLHVLGDERLALAAQVLIQHGR